MTQPKRLRKTLALVFCVVASLSLASCGGGGGGGGGDDQGAVDDNANVNLNNWDEMNWNEGIWQ